MDLDGTCMSSAPAVVNPQLKDKIHQVSAINTIGVSGHAKIINVAGDNITYKDSANGLETYDKIASIEERLKVIHDTTFGTVYATAQRKLISFLLPGCEVYGWLASPDVSANYTAARRKHLPETGFWLIESGDFAHWKSNSKPILGIYGSPGCGKTILCSLIIESVREFCDPRPLSAYAYFFFDNRNSDTGLVLFENLLRSLLSQLSSRSGGIPSPVKELYEKHGNGRERSSLKCLQETLESVIAEFDDVYIMIDSLDECGERVELLHWIKAMAAWNSTKLHLLFTSRPEPDIVNHLVPIARLISAHFGALASARDIELYIDSRLRLNHIWDDTIKSLIKETLIAGANGMFRWVALQIDDLEHCYNALEVEEQLMALPKSLAETYERILVRSRRRRDLQQILHWLAFSVRDMRIEEIADVVSVDLEAKNGPAYNIRLRYSDPKILLTVCSGLITETDGIVKLAHLSVKEYLLSEEIKAGAASIFSISDRVSHSVITETCLAYLLNFDQLDSINEDNIIKFPLATYAAEHWLFHIRCSKNAGRPTLQAMLLRLFSFPQNGALANWIQLYDPDRSWKGTFDGQLEEVTHPIYHASSAGLEQVVEHLLQNGADANMHGGHYGTALHAASYNGHVHTVKLLLRYGANANAQASFLGTCTVLQAASFRGHLKTVNVLIKRGAEVNAKAGSYGTALQATSSAGRRSTGHLDIAKLLLDHGAEVNAQAGEFGTALQAASHIGHLEIVMLLLQRGADVNAQAGEYGTALQAASQIGHLEIMNTLLERGADVNIQAGVYGTALQAASHIGRLDIVDLLFDHAAEVNPQIGKYGTALQAAAHGGHLNVMNVLLERGAEVNAVTDPSSSYGTALQVASHMGHIDIAKLLLDRGAQIDAVAGFYGTALQAAAHAGNFDMVHLLLERDADVETYAGEYGTAMRAALDGCHPEIMRLLFAHGARLGGDVQDLSLYFDDASLNDDLVFRMRVWASTLRSRYSPQISSTSSVGADFDP
ncbi:hypothetical protein HWV62_5558 [Athelia sp. TMB]|nr:hypothetical protein HWV62_5558 [Athelia sp. TMB]